MTGLKEFESVYSYDKNDLYSLGIGSGVHLDEDVFLRFTFNDSQGEELTDNSQLITNNYVKSVIFDIADINDNVIYQNYQSGYSTSLSFTKKDNESIFGKYEKDFCVNFRVEDFTTDIVSSGKYYVYGNALYVSSVKTYDSLGETVFNEPIGPYMVAEFNSGNTVFSGKMTLIEKEDDGLPEKFVISVVKNHPEMPSGLQDHYWEASLTYDFNGSELEPNPSYPSYIPSIKNTSSWTFLFNDLSPSGYFLLSKNENKKNNPYGVYSDSYNSGIIKQYGQDPYKVVSGLVNTDTIAVEVSYENLKEFTKIQALDVYSYNGTELKEDEFSYLKTLDADHAENINIDRSAGLVDNQNTWLRITPKSPFGTGDPWVVGPLLHRQTGESDTSIDVDQVNIKSPDGSANVNFKKGNILNIIDQGSGVLDRIYVNKEEGYEKTIFESNSGLNFDYNTVPVDKNGVWERNYFEYSLTMSDENNPYQIISKTIKLSTTGVATSGANEGLPLFKIEGTEDLEGESLNITPLYSESGVSLLVNTGQNYTTYKFYKTSF